MIKISPSLLAADFGELRKQVEMIEQGGAEMLHLDIMDGHFVPNITFGVDVLHALRETSSLVFDAHLMVQKPTQFVEVFAGAGADIITVHAEAEDAYEAIKLIKSLGKRAGIAIKPETPVDSIKNILPEVDMVLVMSVNPGFTGQKFIPSVVPKIEVLRKMMPQLDIGVDGGINLETAWLVKKAGANVIVAGAAVFRAENPGKAIEALKQ